MEQLIKIHEDNSQRQVVSARELHEYLQVQSRFNDWINNRIQRYGLIEGEDYTSFTKNLVSGGKTTEYAITISTAKELCMVENNEQGKVARLYFIEVEKRLQDDDYILQRSRDILDRRVALLEQRYETAQMQLEMSEEVIREQAPKVEYHDKVLQAADLVNATQIAADLGLSALKFNRWLFNQGLQFRTNGTWVPSAKIKNKKFMQSRTFAYTNRDGETKTAIHYYFTQAGRKYVMELWNKQKPRQEELA